MIHITHVVNPHYFYFKWKKDAEEFDKELDELEMRVKDDAMNAPETDSKSIKVGRIVAVLMYDWNKWIRGVVKSKDVNGSFYIWAIDYGFPLTATSKQIVIMPNHYSGFHIKNKVHIGGLENCLPARNVFDFKACETAMETQKHWSENAIDVFRNAVRDAVKIEFKEVKEMNLQRKPHRFGRLMITGSQSGVEMNFVKCLIDLHEAKLTDENFTTELLKGQTLHQLNWKTLAGVPLQTKTVTSALESGVKAQAPDDLYDFAEGPADKTDDNFTEEDNKFFDESISMIGAPTSRKGASLGLLSQITEESITSLTNLTPISLNLNDKDDDDKSNETMKGEKESENIDIASKKFFPNNDRKSNKFDSKPRQERKGNAFKNNDASNRHGRTAQNNYKKRYDEYDVPMGKIHFDLPQRSNNFAEQQNYENVPQNQDRNFNGFRRRENDSRQYNNHRTGQGYDNSNGSNFFPRNRDKRRFRNNEDTHFKPETPSTDSLKVEHNNE